MGLATGLFWQGLPDKSGGTLSVSRPRRAVVLLSCWGPAARAAQPYPAREWWEFSSLLVAHVWYSSFSWFCGSVGHVLVKVLVCGSAGQKGFPALLLTGLKKCFAASCWGGQGCFLCFTC